MLDIPNNFCYLISIMKIAKICPFSDYVGSKMVKKLAKNIFCKAFEGTELQEIKKKCIPDEKFDQTDSFGKYFL